MIKLIGVGIWVCVVTLASVYFSVQVTNEDPVTEKVPDLLGGLETVRGDIISVPILGKDGVEGYFLTRLAFTVDGGYLDELTIPADQLVTDALYTELIGNKEIDINHLDRFDIASFKENVKNAINKRIGEEVFHDIIIDQIDFLSKADIRANNNKGERSMSQSQQRVGENGPDTGH
ncbi:MAG: hypothetical protein CML31_06030 [Rhizobiales bacterium]|nr:hypothetical protein [Hoeflea sp.]MBG19510.1 hypothetical protein [Hyphomicrobiales bacterium]|tara:strand:+ start:985 stop:1512 length:528 start_codon:yes stop_codon:yes gene_type:complete